MRISDWSSDVCSSDLAAPAPRLTKDRLLDTKDVRRGGHVASLGHRSDLGNAVESPAGSLAFGNAKRCYCFSRSEERRVGKECVSQCRYRGSPYHSKKKQKENTNVRVRQQKRTT